jgi:hypothetical protein
MTWRLQNLIVLSEEFYREISGHPIPTDLGTARALSAIPAALDLFTCFLIAASRLAVENEYRSSEYVQVEMPSKEVLKEMGFPHRCGFFGRLIILAKMP